MTSQYLAAKQTQSLIEERVRNASNALSAITGIGSGPMRLTPDSVKQTAEYRSAKHAYDLAFIQLRAFNASFIKAFSREIKAERMAKGR
jgi:hypothetical protein